MQAEVLTYTVHDDHRVVDIITDNRQDSSDERLVDLQGEAYPTVADGEEADDDDGIKDKGGDGTCGEAYVAETKQDVEEDTYNSEDDAQESVVGDVLRDGRTYLCRTDDGAA